MSSSATLRFFISSTFGLAAERDAVQTGLISLGLDGRRYEEWPAPPGDPMDACLNEVTDCDCVLVLFGKSYGTAVSHPWSGTEAEFRYALKHRKPVLVFELAGEKDDAQNAFLGKEPLTTPPSTPGRRRG